MIYSGRDPYLKKLVLIIFVIIVAAIVWFLDRLWPHYLLFGRFAIYECFLFLVGIWLFRPLLIIFLLLPVYLFLQIIALLFRLFKLSNAQMWVKKVIVKMNFA
jgi:hypothetical protein